MENYKFSYGDKVKITSGFYKGLIGIVRSVKTALFTGKYYIVRLDTPIQEDFATTHYTIESHEDRLELFVTPQEEFNIKLKEVLTDQQKETK